MSIINCAVVNIPQKSSSRIAHKSCRTEASCETGYNNSCLIFTLQITHEVCEICVNCLHTSLLFRAECINFISRFSKIICILEAML